MNLHQTHSYIPLIPLSVPSEYKSKFIKNYQLLTHSTDRLFLFSADHKIEHLNLDFYGPNISPESMKPEHIFNLANKGYIGGLETQLGLISRYGAKYNNIPYIVKLNSKTNTIPQKFNDPLSQSLWTVKNVIDFEKNSNSNICGIGLTIYLGSEYENIMLEQAAQDIWEAHRSGLVTILSIYPKGINVKDEKSFELISGAAGLANALGADFVKLKTPDPTLSNISRNKSSTELLKIITQSAGNTKVICSDENKRNSISQLQEIYDQITVGGISGYSIGRNIFQRSSIEAIALTQAINLLLYQRADLQNAINAYESSIKNNNYI